MARIGMCYESEKDIEKGLTNFTIMIFLIFLAMEWFEKSVDEYPDNLLSTRILKVSYFLSRNLTIFSSFRKYLILKVSPNAILAWDRCLYLTQSSIWLGNFLVS